MAHSQYYSQNRDRLIKNELDRYYRNKDAINIRNKLRYYRKKYADDEDAMLILDDTDIEDNIKLERIKEHFQCLKRQAKFEREKKKIQTKLKIKFNGKIDKLKQILL